MNPVLNKAVAKSVQRAALQLFGTVQGGNLRSGRKVLRKPLKGPYMRNYYPRTVEWMKFKEYVWEDYEFLVEQAKEDARLGVVKRSRGDGRSKRHLS